MALNSLVTAMAFHTYLAHVVAKANDLPVGSGILCIRVGNNLPEPRAGEGNSTKLDKANKLNNAAKAISAIAICIFNLIFWVVAMCEYLKSADEYL